MGHRAALGAVAAVTVFTVLGCGGSGSHTYVLVPNTHGLIPSAGLYFTIVSPVAVPASALNTSSASVVSQAKGPTDCSATKVFQGGSGRAAELNGKSVTVKISGSNPITTLICAALRKGGTFRPSTGFPGTSSTGFPGTSSTGGAPSIVTHVHVRSGPTWLAISWAPATAPRGATLDYSVGVTGNTGVATGCGTSSLSCRVVELTPHHTYTVTVKAINGTVSGPASRPVRVTTG